MFNYRAIGISGHSKKEVCNGISALGYTLAQNLVNEVDTNVHDDGNLFIVELKKGVKPTPESNKLFEVMLTGFQMLYEANKPHVYPITFKTKKEVKRKKL